VAKKAKLPKLSSSKDDVYQIFALRYGTVLKRRVHENFMIRDMHDGPMPLDLFVWVIRNAHRTILVDTGFGFRIARERNFQLEIDPVEGLTRIGLPPDSIENIIITHLHFDHAGNIGKFGKARFHIQDAEVDFATGRCMCDRALRRPFEVDDIVDLVRSVYAGRVTFHDGYGAPFPGVTLHALPGHSKGMQAVKVNTERGPVVLASDVSHYYANFLKRAPFALTIDAMATMRSYSALMELAGNDVERIIPGHDPRTCGLYPSLDVDGVRVWALHEKPKAHDIEELCRTDNL
jgi:glyoxylase-like metal-dependent hydrolase (beta-lactamase superfamily II)